MQCLARFIDDTILNEEGQSVTGLPIVDIAVDYQIVFITICHQQFNCALFLFFLIFLWIQDHLERCEIVHFDRNFHLFLQVETKQILSLFFLQVEFVQFFVCIYK